MGWEVGVWGDVRGDVREWRRMGKEFEEDLKDRARKNLFGLNQ